MGQAAEKHIEEYGAVIPAAETVIYTDNIRETVSQKFEEMAARLRSGELRGGSIQWREGLPAMVTVEAFADTYWDEKYQEERTMVRLTRTTFKPNSERAALVKGQP